MWAVTTATPDGSASDGGSVSGAMPEGRFRRLRAANVAVGVFLVAQAAAVLALSNGLSLPVTAAFLSGDPVIAQGAASGTVLFRLPVGAAVAVFVLLAALDHLVVAAPGVHRWYERHLGGGVNYARWIEYAVSASLMLVLIAMFVGIRDLAALLGFVAANAAMILFGLLMERHQDPGAADWSAYWFAAGVGVVPWVAIAVYLAETPAVPGFVYAIVVTQFVLFFSFAVNMGLQYRQVGRWRSYLFGEGAYMVLSLSAKSLLAWLIFANVLRS